MYLRRGFSSFEFYFVMVVIGLLMLVGIQRYFQLAEQVQRFSFEVIAQHFNTSVYGARAQWYIQQQNKIARDIVNLSGTNIFMNAEGWPLTALREDVVSELDEINLPPVSVETCYQLWLHLLQNPAPISYAGGEPFGSRPYHLSVTTAGDCRYQLFFEDSNQYYFDYAPKTGHVRVHTPVKK